MYDALISRLRHMAAFAYLGEGGVLRSLLEAAADAIEIQEVIIAGLNETVKELADDVRPVVHGEWGYRWKIHGDGRRPTELFPCSECGFENTCVTNYCPNCGADMRSLQSTEGNANNSDVIANNTAEEGET